ncbi:sigma factor-like helix-turn-helix DNA-binding protein [Streptomyces sp. NPDC050392]|uniref:RNA polymerase sigma factor n=1 Tax=Streptomyces sp. NPDC050392 TaxID=3155782 RepID=UPI00343A8484
MSSDSEENRRIPHQRGEGLSSEAQRQWDLMLRMRSSVRRLVYRLTGGAQSTVVDDIESQVWLAIFLRLKNSGPLQRRDPAIAFLRVEPYVYQVTRQKAQAHLAELAKLAEQFVGDHVYLLEQEEVPSAESQSLADLAPAMKVLKAELSELQLAAFVLAEAYDLKSPMIADLLNTTKGTVRDALRHARRKRDGLALIGD